MAKRKMPERYQQILDGIEICFDPLTKECNEIKSKDK